MTRSTTALAVAALFLASPALGADEPKPEPVTIDTKDGVRLAATLYASARQGAPCVILLHMLKGEQEDWKALTPSLRERGYAVLTLDLRGHGKSKTAKADADKLEGAKLKALCRKMKHDLAAAEEFLQGRPEVDSQRLAIVGASIGANVALNHAAKHSSIKSLVLLSPGLDYFGVRTKTPMKRLDKQVPVFLVAAKVDPASHACVVALAAVGKKRKGGAKVEAKVYETEIVEEASGELIFPHGTTILDMEKGLAPRIIAWIEDTLPAAA